MGDPLARSPWEISCQDLCTSSLSKNSLSRSLSLSLCKISLTEAAPYHDESGPTWTDMHKGTSWLREHMSDFYQILRAPQRRIENVRKVSGHFFVEVCKAVPLIRKMSLRHPKFCICNAKLRPCTKSRMTLSPHDAFEPFNTS